MCLFNESTKSSVVLSEKLPKAECNRVIALLVMIEHVLINKSTAKNLLAAQT